MPPYRSQGGRGGSRPYQREHREHREPRSVPVSPENIDQARTLIEYLGRSLVDDPERVRVRSLGQGAGGLMFEMSVAPDDMGKVIGKQGRVANAIRTLLRAWASRLGTRITLEIV